MSHVKERLQLFTLPAFNFYLGSCLLATLGGGISYIAMIWLLMQIHNALSPIAILMSCFWLPGVILGPFMGVLVDRFSRKFLLIFSTASRAVLLFIFAGYLYTHQSATSLYVFALLTGVLFTSYMPAALRFVREIVPADQLLNANSTVDMAYEIGFALGLSLAGVLFMVSSAATAFLVNGICFIFSVILMLCIRKRDIHDTPPEGLMFNVWNDLTQGFRYVLNSRFLIALYSIQLVVFVMYMTAPVLLAPYAKNILHTSARQFGDIEAALSVGMIVGGIFMPWFAEKFGLFKTMLLCVLLLAVAFAWFGYNHVVFIAAALYLLIGLALAIWPVMVTKAQRHTEVQFQGRVQSTFNSIAGLMILLVYFAVKFASPYFSIAHLYSVEVTFSVLAAVLLWRFVRHQPDQ